VADGGNCFFRMLVLPLGNDESPQIATKKRAMGYVHVDYSQFSETAERDVSEGLLFQILCLNCKWNYTSKTTLIIRLTTPLTGHDGVLMAPWTCIREVLCLNLVRDTGYLN
jgi:hypothetical protein